MASGDHRGSAAGYIFRLWCIGVYSDDGLHYYCDGRFLPHCGSSTSPELERPGPGLGAMGRLVSQELCVWGVL